MISRNRSTSSLTLSSLASLLVIRSRSEVTLCAVTAVNSCILVSRRYNSTKDHPSADTINSNNAENEAMMCLVCC